MLHPTLNSPLQWHYMTLYNVTDVGVRSGVTQLYPWARQDDAIRDDQWRSGVEEVPLKIRSKLPGALQKVSQKAQGHGFSTNPHATYGLDGQPPAATTLGAGKHVRPEWQEGMPIGLVKADTVKINVLFKEQPLRRLLKLSQTCQDYVFFYKHRNLPTF